MARYIITNEEVEKMLVTPKSTVSKMKWLEEKSGCGERHKYYSACQIMKTTIDDLYFRSEYKAAVIYPSDGLIKVHEKINAGLFYKNYQISAIHYCQTPHKNKVGSGLPFYRKTINGLHRHIWIDGDAKSGYAEPIIDINEEITLDAILKMFCFENKLSILGGYKPPFTEMQYDIDMLD